MYKNPNRIYLMENDSRQPSGNSLSNPYYQEVSQFYQDADGVFQWGMADPEILEGLELWRQANDKGAVAS